MGAVLAKNIQKGHMPLKKMNAKQYEAFAKINQMDQAIFESENEMMSGGKAIDLNEAFQQLNAKYYGRV